MDLALRNWIATFAARAITATTRPGLTVASRALRTTGR
jgi:hypothetical protein